MTNLSLISVDDLWEEIKRRNDAAVLITVKDRGDDTEEHRGFHSGSKFACIGLVTFFREKVIGELFEFED